MKRFHYLVRINKEPDSDWGASVPDLPGCVATAKTLDRALQRIQRALELHLEGLADDGLKLPKPRLRSVVPHAKSNGVDFYASVGVSARVA